MFDVNTTDVRQFFAAAWKNRFAPLDANQERAVRIIQAHPEYHRYLDKIERWLDYTWQPEQGETNPFLHMSLHLSIQEQVAIDQPQGIAEIHQKLSQQLGDWALAENQMMDALVEMIWQAQRYGTGFDVNAYITQLRRLIGLGEEEQKRLNPHEIEH